MTLIWLSALLAAVEFAGAAASWAVAASRCAVSDAISASMLASVAFFALSNCDWR